MFHFTSPGWSHFTLLSVACCLTGITHPLFAEPPAGNAPAEHGHFVYAVGTVEPLDSIDIAPEVQGRITRVFVDFNSVVHKGDVLAQIDDAAYVVRLDMAKASLQQAHASLAIKEAEYAFESKTLERLKSLAAKGAVTAESLDLAQLRIERARGAVESAKGEVNLHEASVKLAMSDLAATKIVSPVDGVIIDRRVNEGQSVVAGLANQSLFLIAKDLHQLQLWISVNEKDITGIHAGQSVRFTIDAFKNESFAGKVGKIRLNAAMSHNVVTYTVEVNFENSTGRVLPYLTANAQITIGQADHDTK